MICEENDKRVLIFGFLDEDSWMRDELHFLVVTAGGSTGWRWSTWTSITFLSWTYWIEFMAKCSFEPRGALGHEIMQ